MIDPQFWERNSGLSKYSIGPEPSAHGVSATAAHAYATLASQVWAEYNHFWGKNPEEVSMDFTKKIKSEVAQVVFPGRPIKVEEMVGDDPPSSDDIVSGRVSPVPQEPAPARTAMLRISEELLFDLLGLHNFNAELIASPVQDGVIELYVSGTDTRLPVSAEFPRCVIHETRKRIESHLEVE